MLNICVLISVVLKIAPHFPVFLHDTWLTTIVTAAATTEIPAFAKYRTASFRWKSKAKKMPIRTKIKTQVALA